MYKGVDLSSIQGSVDYNWLVQQGISFCIIRCGLGSNQHDPNYAKNVAAAKAAGLKVALYSVAYPLPNDNPEQIATWHYSLGGGELACCDLEFPYPQDWPKRGMSASQVRDWANRYLAKYSELDGRRMILYSYPSFLQACAFTSSDYASSCPLWIASYTPSPAIPKPWDDWTLWQNGGGNLFKLPNGSAIDTDMARDLTLWGAATPVAPPPMLTPEIVSIADPVAANPIPAPVLTTTPAPTPAPGGGSFWTFVTDLLNGLFKR